MKQQKLSPQFQKTNIFFFEHNSKLKKSERVAAVWGDVYVHVADVNTQKHTPRCTHKHTRASTCGITKTQTNTHVFSKKKRKKKKLNFGEN